METIFGARSSSLPEHSPEGTILYSNRFGNQRLARLPEGYERRDQQKIEQVGPNGRLSARINANGTASA